MLVYAEEDRGSAKNSRSRYLGTANREQDARIRPRGSRPASGVQNRLKLTARLALVNRGNAIKEERGKKKGKKISVEDHRTFASINEQSKRNVYERDRSRRLTSKSSVTDRRPTLREIVIE